MKLSLPQAVRALWAWLAIACLCGPLALPAPARAATGTPQAFAYQARLYDASGNLLGGEGTTYCFKFSIWDGVTVGGGSRLWPTGSPSGVQRTVKRGVFSALIGLDTNEALDFNFFDNSTVYLQVEVAPYSGSCGSYETLSPRKQVVAAPYALNADKLDGADAGTGANNVLKLDGSGNASLSASNPGLSATSTNILKLQGAASGDIQFFNGDNVITQSGRLGLGVDTPAAMVDVKNSAVNQLRLRNDNSNYLDIGVNSSGTATLTATGSTPRISLANYTGINSAIAANWLSVNTPSSADSTAQALVSSGGTTNKALVLQGVASQTANLMEVQSNSGSIVAYISASGVGGFSAVNTATVTSNSALAISAASNTNITITPAGSGSVRIGGASNYISVDAAGVLTASGTAVIGRGIETFTQLLAASPTAVHSGAACTGSGQTMSSGITQPDVPRTVSVTDSFSDSTNGQVTVNGTLADGSSSSEAITISDAGTATGAKAFAKITSFQLPASCAATTTISLGLGSALGLANPLHDQNTVYKVKRNAADIAIGSVDTANSTVDLSTITAGDDVTIWYRY